MNKKEEYYRSAMSSNLDSNNFEEVEISSYFDVHKSGVKMPVIHP